MALGQTCAREDEMSTKHCSLSVIVVLMILAFTVSTVGAQAEPPVMADKGEWDVSTLADLSGFTSLAENYIPPTDLISIDSEPAPISPVSNFIYTKTPTYYFHRDHSATKYRLEVYDVNASEIVISMIAPATCSGTYCWLKPTTKLKILTARSEHGSYSWRVTSKVKGEWQTPSPTANFIVLSKGFYNDFSTAPSKWLQWNGVWDWIETKGILRTSGNPGVYNSVFHEALFQNFEYTARLKRTITGWNSNVLAMGFPGPETVNHRWYHGVYFGYNNDGLFWIFINKDGLLAKQDVIATDVIVPYGWNEIKMAVMDPYVDFWINGTYIGWINIADLDLELSLVGVDMYAVSDGGKLLIDWAQVKSMTVLPTSVHDPAQELVLHSAPSNVDMQDPAQ